MNNKIYNWEKIYYGQSPGDLENKNNGFAGRFSGYNNKIISPSTNINSELPVILIVGDSIIGDICVLNIREKFKGIANVNFLQQPHHCKNIDSWLEEWKINEWKHYHCVFWFDGMHGFPERVTEEEHQKLTPKLINNLQNQNKDDETEVLSPTFNIVYEYEISEFKIMHYDLYRLKTEKDIQQLGIFEQDTNNIKVIEWAEIIKNKPFDRLEVYMSYEKKQNMRKIDFKGFGKWEKFSAI